METELFMECEEEELEPWQQVDDCVEEEDVDFMDGCEAGGVQDLTFDLFPLT